MLIKWFLVLLKLIVQERELNWNDTSVIFEPDDVLKRLQKLQGDKSPGPDGLHPYFLKECAASIAEPQSIIVSKGTTNDKTNYRPVSLTAVSCRIMESMIREKLLAFLEDNELLSELQHGFMRGRSCLKILLESLEDWTAA